MLSIIRLRLMRLRDDYIIILLMTIMALAFTFISGASQNKDYTPTILVIDQDSSTYSQLLIDELIANKAYKYSMSTYEEAVKSIEDNKILASIVVTENFSNSIEKGEAPTINLIKAKDDIDIFTLESLLNSVSGKMIGNIRIAQITTEYMNASATVNEDGLFTNIYNKAVEGWKYKKPIDVTRQTYEGSDTYDALKHSIIGFTLFFSMYTIVFAIGEILVDKKNNTWQRLIISPISKASILGGNFIMTFILGMFQVSIIILGGQLLFGVDLGNNMAGILIIAAAFVFTITALGLFLSGLVKTHSQLAALTPVVLTSTAMIGGCMWPLEIVNSKVLLFIANLTPQKWAIEGMEKIAVHGHGLEAILTPTIVLLGMGILFFGLGVRLIKFE